MINHHEGWNKRKVNYREIHGITREEWWEFLRAARIKSGQIFVDLMSGYGEVTKKVLDFADSNSFQVNPILVDFSKEQLERSYESLPQDIPRICEDARSLSLKNNSVDRVLIKMGLHEVPRKDQYQIIKEAHRILKPGGIIAIWDLMFKSRLEQLVFQAIIREKDRIAGFNYLALNRYLPNYGDLLDYFKTAAFKAPMQVDFNHPFSSRKRLDSEFGGDQNKLNELNSFIRAIIPEDIKKSIWYEDDGDTIDTIFHQGILSAVK